MKLTAAIVESAPSYTDPLHQTHLDLRDLQIPYIENLGPARDVHACLDLTGNDLRSLINFPRMHRLRCLMLANNRVSKIDPLLYENLPNLEAIVFTGNAITELREMEGFKGCHKLEWLSMMGCPVTRVKGYREWLIWRFPKLRVLDFQRVRQKVRLSLNLQCSLIPRCFFV